MRRSEKDCEQNRETNLILGIENGDGFQDGFEWTKCLGWPLRYVDRKCSTPKSPVDPSSLLY